MSTEKLFEIGGQWIGRVDGRKGFYAFRYDGRSRQVVRSSLKTTNFEEAKEKLASQALTAVVHDPRNPDEVMLVAVLNHYFENHSDAKVSAEMARRAGELVLTFLEEECGHGPEVKVGTFTKGIQMLYAMWASKKHGHSPAYISRCLSVIAAACRFAAKTVVKLGPDNQITESRILNAMPEICYDGKWLAEVINKPEPAARDVIPTFEQLASLLDTEGSEVLQRFDILALNTWARPEAILELRIKGQIDFDNSLLDLNPPGRKQTKKHRPTIRLTSNLRGWLEHWGEDSPLTFTVSAKGQRLKRQSASHIKAQFKRRTFRWMLTQNGLSCVEIDDLFRLARQGKRKGLNEAIAEAERRGIPRITPYSYRHFMATKVRAVQEVRVDREQRSLWLGHGKKDTTSWYEKHDPEHLRECAIATSIILDKLDALTTRSLVPPMLKTQRQLAGLKAA
jgi:integrase